MKDILLKFKNIFALLVLLTLFSNCSQDELGPSIFNVDEEVLDSTSYTYKFDKFLEEEFLLPYNLQFTYKMKSVSVDMNYNLVPSTFENSEKLALLVKYLWFDVYKKIANEDFLKLYGPRMIHLIGSPAFNPSTGTMLLGLAEGGIKISLYKVNEIDITDVDEMNEFYFKTMHHEFAHILHQTKNWPVDFNLISYKNYDPYSWQERTDEEAWSLGFASPYGSSQVREDFVEIIANYIVKSDAQWNNILTNAAKGWKVDEASGDLIESDDADGVDGKEVILKKLSICRNWFKDQWKIDLDALRAEVQYRQTHIDMDELMKQINNR